MVRTIVKVKRLFDVSPVTYPAYPDTTVASRSLEQFTKDRDESKQKEIEAESAHRRRRLTMLEISGAGQSIR